MALFDDARCRGADLALQQTAVGLLTLAAGMPKDKLMQAAGRLRQLGRGQRVVLMGLPDISSKIAAAVAAMTAVTGPVAVVSSSAAAAAAAAGESTIGGRNKRSGLKLDWFSPKKQKGGSREPDMRAVQHVLM
jgi:hypothetical protein